LLGSAYDGNFGLKLKYSTVNESRLLQAEKETFSEQQQRLVEVLSTERLIEMFNRCKYVHTPENTDELHLFSEKKDENHKRKRSLDAQKT
jgi:hypothetical protein